MMMKPPPLFNFSLFFLLFSSLLFISFFSRFFLTRTFIIFQRNLFPSFSWDSWSISILVLLYFAFTSLDTFSPSHVSPFIFLVYSHLILLSILPLQHLPFITTGIQTESQWSLSLSLSLPFIVLHFSLLIVATTAIITFNFSHLF